MIKNLLNYIRARKEAKVVLFYAITLAFILLSGYLFLMKETLLGAAIPLVLIIVLIVIFSYDKLIWLAVIFSPLSIPLHELKGGLPFDMFLPTEPLLFGILLLFLISIIRGNRLNKDITRHPVAKVIYVYIGWMALTIVTSSLPLVSFKYWLSRIWFLVAFFFLLSYLFQYTKNITKVLWMYCIAMIPVIGYAWFRHFGYGLWDDKAAHFVMNPFFNDHTSYGAALAFFIPYLITLSFSSWMNKKYKIWALLLLVIFFIAVLLSYSRAAWLSLAFGFGIWVVMKLKWRFKPLFITLIALILIGFSFQQQILLKLEQNSTDSSANLTDHFTSMTNISTDASNLERINRWSCAIRMFEEKPIFGWGPGTYAMKYGPYQLTRERTIISTNAGDMGNAHSEYLGSLAEMGVLGTVTYLLLLIFVMYYGINAYTRVEDKRLKSLVMAAVIAFSTYIFHGILNNFLDTDKISVPFWGSIAIIVAIDIYSKKQVAQKSLVEVSE